MNLRLILAVHFAMLPNIWSNPAIIETNESRPVAIGDLEFSVVTQTEWPNPKLPTHMGGERSVNLQLRLTNSGTTPVLFPTIDTFRPILKGPDGKEVKFVALSEKRYVADPPAVLLQPDRSYSIPLRARMLLGATDKPNFQLITARTAYTTNPILAPGRYTLSMMLLPTRIRIGADNAHSKLLWSAAGLTKPVSFRIVASPTTNRGGSGSRVKCNVNRIFDQLGRGPEPALGQAQDDSDGSEMNPHMNLLAVAKEHFSFLMAAGFGITDEQEGDYSSYHQTFFRLAYSSGEVAIGIDYLDLQLDVSISRGGQSASYLLLDRELFANGSGFAGNQFSDVPAALEKIAADIEGNYARILTGDPEAWAEVLAVLSQPPKRRRLP